MDEEHLAPPKIPDLLQFPQELRWDVVWRRIFPSTVLLKGLRVRVYRWIRDRVRSLGLGLRPFSHRQRPMGARDT